MKLEKRKIRKGESSRVRRVGGREKEREREGTGTKMIKKYLVQSFYNRFHVIVKFGLVSWYFQ